MGVRTAARGTEDVHGRGVGRPPRGATGGRERTAARGTRATCWDAAQAYEGSYVERRKRSRDEPPRTDGAAARAPPKHLPRPSRRLAPRTPKSLHDDVAEKRERGFRRVRRASAVGPVASFATRAGRGEAAAGGRLWRRMTRSNGVRVSVLAWFQSSPFPFPFNPRRRPRAAASVSRRSRSNRDARLAAASTADSNAPPRRPPIGRPRTRTRRVDARAETRRRDRTTGPGRAPTSGAKTRLSRVRRAAAIQEIAAVQPVQAARDTIRRS